MRKKIIIALLILLGITINVLAFFFFRKAEFAIILAVVIYPSTIILSFCFLLVWRINFKERGNKYILLFFILSGWLSPVLLSFPMFRELHFRVFKKNEFAYREFMRKDIAPIENGKWEYSKNGIKLAKIDFADGKIHGMYKMFNINEEVEEVRHYSMGELDSIVWYDNKNKTVSYKYLGDTIIHRIYDYDANNALIKVVDSYLVSGELIRSDTIKLN
jgi:hypothetical protein